MQTERFDLNKPAADPGNWLLDPRVVYLNHGSFGGCPQAVLNHQDELRRRLERQPVKFLSCELEGMLDDARTSLARFLCADAANLVFVPNATTGVNSVLRSLRFDAGDELLVTNHEYNACRNALEFAASRNGARVVVAQLPFPLTNSDEVVTAILECVTDRTKLALIDHVTSQTALVLPIEKIVRELASRGVDTLVDGAHAPGMTPLELTRLGAAYYAGNCHKWLCAPKGAAFLHVRPDRQELIHPLTISHGLNSKRTDRSRFLLEFCWTGTGDPTAWLSVPAALKFMESALAGEWPAVMERNRTLALAAQKLLAEVLGIAPPAPNEMIGSMASLPIHDRPVDEKPIPPAMEEILQTRLREKRGIEVPIISWPAPPHRLLRVSAQLYNSLPQYQLLADAISAEVSGGHK